jgi:hypothetical protein
MSWADGSLMSVFEIVSPAGKNHLFSDLGFAGADLGKQQRLQKINRGNLMSNGKIN